MIRFVHRAALAAIYMVSLNVPAKPISYLDEDTAATITVVSEPLVFARGYPALAVNARDYLTLCAVQVNRSGHFAQYLYGYLWSTIDRRRIKHPGAPPGLTLHLLADDRGFALAQVAASIKSLGMVRPPCEPPSRGVPPVMYAIDAAALAFIAEARRLVVRPQIAADEDIDSYRLWSDGRPALRDLVVEIGSGGLLEHR